VSQTAPAPAPDDVITVENLSKEFRLGVRLKRVRAVIGATFAVKRGEIFGFVGPNGAGKTTTIRTLMGLIRPSAGRCTILGHTVPSRAARQKVGFLPEAPYFYDYLSARELLDLCGRLFGLDAATRRRRADELLAKVGLTAAADRPMRKYSKGMLQRAGLAQALINDPEVIVLDEPMSGLDPIGRKEVRDLITELGAAGKTVFFSTHILPDVEAICDRVAIISLGKVHDVGPVGTLLQAKILGTDVVLEVPEERDHAPLVPPGGKARRVGREVAFALPPDLDVDEWLRSLSGVRIRQVTPRKESLEDLYVRVTRRAPAAPPAGGPP
jgi:ABC-2 type transport system ATP-binding protein